jgi:ABC-type lipoprotein export system ATPase subunit
MLELKNITITDYVLNKRLLDNINLDFENKGLVFVTGKNEQTLNALFEVFKADKFNGELVINGKSSKYLTKNEFKQYKNNSISLIAQDNNLIDNITAEQNLRLVNKISGRETEKKYFEELIKEAEIDKERNLKTKRLSEFKKKKLTLAREKAKNIDIMIIQEPVYKLYSKEAIAIIGYIKELSKQKLIIVVMKNIDLALLYADRIIDISDGKVISDISRINGAELTEFKIPFEKTPKIIQNDIIYGSHFNNIKIPFRFLLITAIKYLKKFQVKLFFTAFLTVLTLLLISLASFCNTYNVYPFVLNFIKNEQMPVLSIKNKFVDNYDAQYKISYNKEQLTDLNNKTGYKFKPIINFSRIEELYASGVSSYYRNCSCSAFVEFDTTDIYIKDNKEYLNNFNYEIIGNYPTNNNEVAISSYIYEQFEYLGYYKNEILTEINSMEDLIGKEITIDDNLYNITAIIDVGKMPSKFDCEKSNYEHSSFEFKEYLENSLQPDVFVGTGFLDKIIVSDNYKKSFKISEFSEFSMTNSGRELQTDGSVTELNSSDSNIIYLTENTDLGKNDFVMSSYCFFSFYQDEIDEYMNSLHGNSFEKANNYYNLIFGYNNIFEPKKEAIEYFIDAIDIDYENIYFYINYSSGDNNKHYTLKLSGVYAKTLGYDSLYASSAFISDFFPYQECGVYNSAVSAYNIEGADINALSEILSSNDRNSNNFYIYTDNLVYAQDCLEDFKDVTQWLIYILLLFIPLTILFLNGYINSVYKNNSVLFNIYSLLGVNKNTFYKIMAVFTIFIGVLIFVLTLVFYNLLIIWLNYLMGISLKIFYLKAFEIIVLVSSIIVLSLLSLIKPFIRIHKKF